MICRASHDVAAVVSARVEILIELVIHLHIYLRSARWSILTGHCYEHPGSVDSHAVILARQRQFDHLIWNRLKCARVDFPSVLDRRLQHPQIAVRCSRVDCDFFGCCGHFSAFDWSERVGSTPPPTGFPSIFRTIPYSFGVDGINSPVFLISLFRLNFR